MPELLQRARVRGEQLGQRVTPLDCMYAGKRASRRSMTRQRAYRRLLRTPRAQARALMARPVAERGVLRGLRCDMVLSEVMAWHTSLADLRIMCRRAPTAGHASRSGRRVITQIQHAEFAPRQHLQRGVRATRNPWISRVGGRPPPAAPQRRSRWLGVGGAASVMGARCAYRRVSADIVGLVRATVAWRIRPPSRSTARSASKIDGAQRRGRALLLER